MYAVSSSQMKALEEKCIAAGITEKVLMHNAGIAAALSINGTIPVEGKCCVLLCGKGGNGGDGFVTAMSLHKMGAHVKIILADGLPKSRLAQEQYEAAYADKIAIIDLAMDPYKAQTAMNEVDIVVDAIFGTGYRGVMSKDCNEACRLINTAIAAVFSLDVPSGLETDSFSGDDNSVHADFTVVFDSLKPVHIMPLTAKQCGKICVVDIGIPSEYKNDIKYNYAVVDESHASSLLPVRAQDSHKGDHGVLLNLVGSESYMGAAVLACLGGLRSGVGRVHLASVPRVCDNTAAYLPEVTFTKLPANVNGRVDSLAFGMLAEAMEKATAICIGCGLGLDGDTKQLVYSVITKAKCPVIIDADGINAIAENINILNDATAPIILTPHMGELARLLCVDIATLQKDKYELVGNFAKRYSVTVVCKGYRTFTAPQAVGAYINTTGNSGLAKAGSGDLLAGIIASFAAQGLLPEQAAAVGAYYHGKAADLCAQDLNQMYMQPTDVARYLSKAYPNK